MRSISAKLLTLFFLIAFPFGTTAGADDSIWKAGVGRGIITPEKSVWLAGYGTRRPPDGKLHDLWVKTLALEDAKGERVVLITSDFQGVPRSMSDRVFERLQAELSLERSQVMFAFSHNHCGPRLGDDLVDYYPYEAEQERLVAEYTDQMVERTIESVKDAIAGLSPAMLKTGIGQATFAVNRRNNVESEVADKLQRGVPLHGPVDHSVPVMAIERLDGTLTAVLFGYACHPTTLSFTKWCGDYPGFAQLEIERAHPGATAMFVNTCGGDQNPLPRQTVELCEKYGKMLSDGVEEVLGSGSLQRVNAKLEHAFTYVQLPYLEVASRETLTSLREDANAIKSRWAGRMLQKLDAGESFEREYPYPLHVWRFGGEVFMFGMGAETVVDYALKYKEKYGARTWVLGYTDDMISYIPSRRVWEEGGYEGGFNLYEYGRPAFRWSGDIEERIDEGFRKMMDNVERNSFR